MPSPQQPPPDRKAAAAASREIPVSAASRETKKPTDSVPMATGTFAALPARFGRYQVEKLLGHGMMGAVYLARDTQLDRLVALKIPRVSAAGSAKLLKRLEVEAKAAAKLHHPNICSVYDYGVLNDVHFIALQYVEGHDLKSWLKRRGCPLAPAAAIRLMTKLAGAVGEAHRQEIIHRDLKPENIMLKPDGEPVIMDFGLARRASGATDAGLTQGMIVGTALYMSPEQANGRAEGIDHRSDIYALGVMLFELLTGAWPFSGTAFEVMGQKTVQEPPTPLDVDANLPPQLAALCHKMISRKKEDRYATCAEVIAALEAIDLDAPAPSIPTPSAEFSLDFLAQEPAPVPGRRITAKSTGNSRILRWTALAGAGAISIALGVMLFFQTPYGVLQIEIEDPTLSVKFDGQSITVDSDSQPIRVTATADHTLEVFYNGVIVNAATQPLTVKRNGRRLVTVGLRLGNIVVDGNQIPLENPKSSVAVSESPAGGGVRPSKGASLADGRPSDSNATLSVALDEPLNTFRETCSLAEQSLLERFSEAMRKVSQTEAIDDQTRSTLISRLIREEMDFKKYRRIPFSAHMRQPSIEYVDRIDAARKEGLRSCDQLAQSLADNGGPASDAAQKAIANHRKVLKEPAVVAVWDMGHDVILRSDWTLVRSTGLLPGTWFLDEKFLTYRSPAAGAPGGAWVDTNAISDDGLSYLGQNQGGAHFFGKLKLPNDDTPTEQTPVASSLPEITAHANTSRIPVDAVVFRDKRFKLYPEHLSWHAAKAKCEALGGRLAEVRSVEENDFVTRLAIERIVEGVWLGATDEAMNGTWRWSDGSKVIYSNWTAGQPNTTRDTEDFLLLTIKHSLGQWSHQPADSLQYTTAFICEWDAVAASPVLVPADPPPTAIAPFNAVQAKKHQEAWAKYLGVPVESTNSIGMKLQLIPPGEFLMGSTPEQIEEVLKLDSDATREEVANETPQSRVQLTKPFRIGAAEVTVGQFRRFVSDTGYKTQAETDGKGGSGWNDALGAFEGPNPRYTWNYTGFVQTETHPVANVTWNDAAAFIKWLGRLENAEYRLPTEAEWEYSCRAGTTSLWWHGDTPENLASCDNIADVTAKRTWGKSHPRFPYISGNDGHAFASKNDGSHSVNPFGLQNMHGNAFEWCQDWYEAAQYRKRAITVVDPTGPSSGANRIFRGGSWFAIARHTRSAIRGQRDPDTCKYSGGFRVVRSLDAPEKSLVSSVAPGISDPEAKSDSAVAPMAEAEEEPVPEKPAAKLPKTLTSPFTPAAANASQRAWGRSLRTPIVERNSVGMDLVLIPPGSFQMGSLAGTADARPVHQVTLTKPFYLGTCEVTQSQYQQIMNANPSSVKAPNNPVESVSWELEAVGFCRRLSELPAEKKAGRIYRLPSEAEWEYACRAGSTSEFPFGTSNSQLATFAWYFGNSNRLTHPVGQKLPNAFGLFDMHGNVCEWCQDWSGGYSDKAETDPHGPASGPDRINRGGSFVSTTDRCETAARGRSIPAIQLGHIGFRVALDVPGK